MIHLLDTVGRAGGGGGSLTYFALIFGLLVSYSSTMVPPVGVQRFGHSSAVLHNGTMIVFGGYNFIKADPQSQHFEGLKNDIWSFDFTRGKELDNSTLTTGEWTMIQVALDSPVPPPRMFHGAFIVYNGTKEVMVINGGTNDVSYVGAASTIYRSCGLSDVWAFDFEESRWTKLVESANQCSGGQKIGWGTLPLLWLVVVGGYLFQF